MLHVIGQKGRADVAAVPYLAHPSKIENGNTYLITNDETEIPILVFGEHNMKNISGAKEVCERLGITNQGFYDAIQSFKGASKRLELIGHSETTNVYRDFAHAPSKVEATTNAVKTQFPSRKLVACAELHTFSSLNKTFLSQYRRKLHSADIAIVYFNAHTLETKQLEPLTVEDIKTAFKRDDLHVFTDSTLLKEFLVNQNWHNANLLMMSSGTFGDIDFKQLTSEVLK